MARKLVVFVSSAQKELEDERLIVQNLLNTDSFLASQFTPLLFKFEPAAPDKATVLVQGEALTSRACEAKFGVTRETANRDFAVLMQLELAIREGRGRSTRYVLGEGG